MDAGLASRRPVDGTLKSRAHTPLKWGFRRLVSVPEPFVSERRLEWGQPGGIEGVAIKNGASKVPPYGTIPYNINATRCNTQRD
jgi:hypothetical protein